MEKSFSEALDFRHACKLFDEDKKISNEDIRYILEAGRKSPSSFGMEGWKFLVITNDTLKEQLKPLCWNQPQITTCSHLVIILTAIENVKPDSGIPAKRFARRQMPQEKYDFYLKLYADSLKQVLSSDENIYAWTSKQTYIAAGNMMSAGAIKGIDSCPIEGYNKGAVEKTLKLDTTKWQLSLVIPFGYRVNPQSKQQRLSFDEVVEFIK